MIKTKENFRMTKKRESNQIQQQSSRKEVNLQFNEDYDSVVLENEIDVTGQFQKAEDQQQAFSLSLYAKDSFFAKTPNNNKIIKQKINNLMDHSDQHSNRVDNDNIKAASDKIQSVICRKPIKTLSTMDSLGNQAYLNISPLMASKKQSQNNLRIKSNSNVLSTSTKREERKEINQKVEGKNPIELSNKNLLKITPQNLKNHNDLSQQKQSVLSVQTPTHNINRLQMYQASTQINNKEPLQQKNNLIRQQQTTQNSRRFLFPVVGAEEYYSMHKPLKIQQIKNQILSQKEFSLSNLVDSKLYKNPFSKKTQKQGV